MKFKIPTVSDRFEHVIKNAISTGITKSVGIVTNLAMVPLTVGYLGSEQYGLWMAISSLIAILQLMDMGIGNALISMVAHSKNGKTDLSIKTLLVSALCTLTIIGIAIYIIAVITTPYINWQWIFNYKDTSLNQLATESILAFIGYFSINTALSVVQPIRLGMQQGHFNGLYNTAGQVLNIITVYCAIKSKSELPTLIIASVAGTILCNIANLLMLKAILPTETLALKKIKLAGVLIFKKGSGFFILQLLSVVSYNLDNVIVAHYAGLNKVPEYSIAMKIFSMPGMILTLLFSGLWAAYADAASKNDWNWIKKAYKKTLKVSSSVSLGLSLLLALTLPWTMTLLSKGTANTSWSITFGMFLWGTLSAVGGGIASLLNGLHILKIQTYAAIVSAILNITLSIALTKALGNSGPIWGSVISLLIIYPALGTYTFSIINNRKLSNG